MPLLVFFFRVFIFSLPSFLFFFFFLQAALEDALDSTTLGDLWFEHGELKEARYEHLRALRIRMAKLPAGHRDVAESLESLGNVAIREVRLCVLTFALVQNELLLQQCFDLIRYQCVSSIYVLGRFIYITSI